MTASGQGRNPEIYGSNELLPKQNNNNGGVHNFGEVQRCP